MKKPLTDTDKVRAIMTRANNVYLITIVISMLIGVSGVIVIITLRPDLDFLIVAGVVFAFLAPTTTSILSLLKSDEANKQAKETHLSVNSRLDAFIRAASALARAEGIQEGRDIESLKMDDRKKSRE